MSTWQPAAGWTTQLTTRRGTFIILAVATGDGSLRDPGPVLTLRALGSPEAPEFTASLGEADFATLRTPGGIRPYGAMLPGGQFTTPVKEAAP